MGASSGTLVVVVYCSWTGDDNTVDITVWLMMKLKRGVSVMLLVQEAIDVNTMRRIFSLQNMVDW